MAWPMCLDDMMGPPSGKFLNELDMELTMKFLVTLERDEDGFIVAECPQLPGCLSQGKTRREALKNIREAIRASLATRRDRGLPLSVETTEVEVAV